MANEQVELWRETAKRTLLSAERLRLDKDDKGCVNRAYYAAYQAATAICLEHRDISLFAHGWNNPAHDQLPDLLRNNQWGFAYLSSPESIKASERYAGGT